MVRMPFINSSSMKTSCSARVSVEQTERWLCMRKALAAWVALPPIIIILVQASMQVARRLSHSIGTQAICKAGPSSMPMATGITGRTATATLPPTHTTTRLGMPSRPTISLSRRKNTPFRPLQCCNTTLVVRLTNSLSIMAFSSRQTATPTPPISNLCLKKESTTTVLRKEP